MGIAALIFLVLFVAALVFSAPLKKILGEPIYKWVLIGLGAVFAVLFVLYSLNALRLYFWKSTIWLILALIFAAIQIMFFIAVYPEIASKGIGKIDFNRALPSQLMLGGGLAMVLLLVIRLLWNLFSGEGLITGYTLTLIFMTIGAIAFFFAALYDLPAKSNGIMNQMRVAAVALALLPVLQFINAFRFSIWLLIGLIICVTISAGALIYNKATAKA